MVGLVSMDGGEQTIAVFPGSTAKYSNFFFNVALLGQTPLKFHFLQLHLSSFAKWFVPSKLLTCNKRAENQIVDWIALIGSTCFLESY